MILSIERKQVKLRKLKILSPLPNIDHVSINHHADEFADTIFMICDVIDDVANIFKCISILKLKKKFIQTFLKIGRIEE